MYKLCKVFASKAKQVARDKAKESGGGLTEGVKKDSLIEREFAPFKLSSQIQDSVKQFKVQYKTSVYGIMVLYMHVSCMHTGTPASHPHSLQPWPAPAPLGQDE